MIRIGIVGTESSHASAFANLFNIEEKFDGFRVTAVLEDEKLRTNSLAQEYLIDSIYTDIYVMAQNVDVAMILNRDANLHKKHSTPFIENKVPVWIDKPFTLTAKDAIEITRLAQKYNVFITGGSTCIYLPILDEIKQCLSNKSIMGDIQGAYMDFLADFDNLNGGMIFYGTHLIEMALNIFGYNPIGVKTLRSNYTCVVVFEYETYDVTLRLINNIDSYNIIINGNKSTKNFNLNINDSYKYGLEAFVRAINKDTCYIEEHGKRLLKSVEIFEKYL